MLGELVTRRTLSRRGATFSRIPNIFYLLGVLWMLGLMACSQTSAEEKAHSVLFEKIFLDTGTTFRGVNLGDSLIVAEQKEANSPKHRDLWGLAYEYQVSSEQRFKIEYYIDNLKTGKETNRIISIIGNIFIENEIETAKLYNEIVRYFQRKYGPPIGKHGAYIWENKVNNIEIRLTLYEESRGLSVNFIDLTPL